MVEISAGHSLFGKHPYIREQLLLTEFGKQIDSAIGLVKPMAVMIPLPLEKLPFHYRRRKVLEHLDKAKKVLNEIGV
jgi:hypothetical protein